MTTPQPNPLLHPVFNPVFQDWEGDLHLPAFERFGSRLRAYRRDQPADIAHCSIGDELADGPSPGATASLWAVVKHQHLLASGALEWVLPYYGWLQDIDGYEDVPRVYTQDDLLPHLRLDSLHVKPRLPDGDGPIDIGVEFACAVDEEHGVGVFFRDFKPVAVGDVDIALADWEWIQSHIQSAGDGRTPPTYRW